MRAERIEPSAYFGLFAFALAVHVLWYLIVQPQAGFADNDGYMRVLRVEALWRDGDWFDRSIPRYDPPYGYDVHWSRPLDVLISLLGAPLIPFLGLKLGLFWGGALSGPVLHAGAVAALAWAARPLIGRAAAILASLAASVQYPLIAYGSLLRADHHIFYPLVAALALGFAIRALDRATAPDANSFLAGLAAAGGVWIGIEALVFAAVSLAAFVFAWLAGRDGAEAPRASRFAYGFTLGLVVALTIERGPRAFEIEYNQLSVVHATLGVLIALFFAATRVFAARGRLRAPPARVAFALAGAAVAVGIWISLFPKALHGPMADYVPEYVAYHLQGFGELGPGYTFERLPLTLGTVLLAIPWLGWRLWRNSPDRWVWVYVAAYVAIYGALAAGWTRWALYAGFFSCLPLGDLLQRATERIKEFGIARLWRESLSATAVMVVLVGPLATAYLVNVGPNVAGKAGGGEADVLRPSVAKLADALNRPPWSERPRVVLVGINYVGEILYRTRHQVVGMSHADAEHWRDIENAFGARDDATARAILARRGVELIAIAPGADNEGLRAQAQAQGGFYDRLRTAPPAWVRPIELPSDASEFRLFEVLPEGRGR